MRYAYILSALVIVSLRTASAQVTEAKLTDDTIYVIGSKEKVFTTPGSATFLNSSELKSQEVTDIGRVLDKVPGVYIQEEDGLGLRPNIGLRGAHPHRSKKVTLLEDGILIGPAPYSAPAAYYFPTMSLASGLEVFKGPSSVKYGPNSIGGAVNIVTRPIETKPVTKIDLSLGQIQKGMIANSGSTGDSGYLVEYHRFQTQGFMTLPNGKDTGTSKNDFSIKLEEKIGAGIPQKISLKGSYATEDSNETYLGLSSNDFQRSPKNRYAASSDDQIEWTHKKIQLKHEAEINSSQSISTTIYHHGFDRKWFKFNGFKDKRELRSILNNSSDNRTIELLRGNIVSNDPNDNFILGNNDRRYLSQGVQTQLSTLIDGDGLSHDLEIGLRLHRDNVKRNHSEIDATLANYNLNYQNETLKTINLTHDEAKALTLFINDEISVNNVTISLGTRIENVQYESSSLFTPADIKKNRENAVVPGLGVNYLIRPDLSLFSGINRGVTLSGPGEDAGAKIEESINVEMGSRFNNKMINAEFIGFLSEYSNIKGTCTFSSGCTGNSVDQSFSGGKARILGIESLFETSLASENWEFPISFGYTRTVAKFKQKTRSENEEWGIGEIQSGDPLPYIPEDQWNLKLGTRYKNFSSNMHFLWKGKMADQSVKAGRKIIPSYGVIDMMNAYTISDNKRAYLKIDNLMDKVYMTSLRPFGYRMGKPRMLSLGYEQKF